MTPSLLYLPAIIRHFGLSWVGYRFFYALRQRLGLLRRQFPTAKWAARALPQFLRDSAGVDSSAYFYLRPRDIPAFFFTPSDIQNYRVYFAHWEDADASPVSDSEGIRSGSFRYFAHNVVQSTFPPDWHENHLTGHKSPAKTHWSEIDDFDGGDIKLLWELSRFSFVYPLVRAYWRTGNERYAETFWQLVEDWREKNPPNCGVNWKCGQEIAIRVMAWCFGLYGFLNARATDADRVHALVQMIAVSGERIEGNIGYALSQRNNHGISEAVGLWTIGLLFPELKKAEKWRNEGRRYLEEQGRSLIYEDGSFSQHSVNYHRLMLHNYLWALRLGDLNAQPFSDELKARVKRSGEWLRQVSDAQTGQVPHYGQNDGALLLPLSACDYLDFRPVMQAAHYYFSGARLFANGPWDEDLLWLFGPSALAAPISERGSERDFAATNGGYYKLSAEAGFAFVRCATFRNRPGQADLLHVDLWWRGRNIACDAGTFSYNSPAPWNNPFARTAYHNTVTVDDRDQMDRVARFLWLPWLKGKVYCCKRSSAGHLAYWEGSHDGYKRMRPPVDHRRGGLQLGDESWLIVDSLASAAPHRYRLHWLFPDMDHSWQEEHAMLNLKTEAGTYHVQTLALPPRGVFSFVRGDEKSPRGWRAPYYSYKEPALSLDLSVENASVLFLTCFSPESFSFTWKGDVISVKADSWRSDLSVQTAGEKEPLVCRVLLTGIREDRLDLN